MNLNLLEPKMADTFFKYFVQDETHDFCWEWQGRLDPQGYGRWGQSTLAHRESARRFLPNFDNTLKVLHSCDNPKCVRPSHLWQGTQADNMYDKWIKNRTARGEGIACSKLTETQVREIRSLWDNRRVISMPKLGKMFGVSHTTIKKIVQRITWQHVED